MIVTIKALKERTSTKQSKYLIVETEEDVGGSLYCWTPELFSGKKPGDKVELVVDERNRNGKIAFYINEVKDYQPEADSADDAPIPEEDIPEPPDEEVPIPCEEVPIPAEPEHPAQVAKPTSPSAPKNPPPIPPTQYHEIKPFSPDNEDNSSCSTLALYNKARSVPDSAKKPISAGRLKNMTDINPMWRIKKLTEMFGPVGFGWKYVITKKELVEVINNYGKKEIKSFVDIDLFYKYEGEWSEAIPGTGGSTFLAQENSGSYVSDECYKMALTDAISVACKAIGIGADVYWAADSGDKYL